MPQSNRFILSDHTVNSFGFVVFTDGIGLDTFSKNPVMLHDHKPCNAVGKWIDVLKEGDKLTAAPEFDIEDEEAKKLKGKVDRGYIKGASIGFAIQEIRFDQAGYEGVPVVTKCELYEASITALPSNANALRIYNEEGKLMTDQQVRDFIQLSKESSTNQNFNMKNLALIIATLQLNPASTEEQVIDEINKRAKELSTLSTKVTTLETENTTLKAQVDQLNTKVADEAKQRVDALVDGAIAANKLTAGERDTWHKLATADYESTKKAIDSRPAHTTVTSQLNNQQNGADAAFEGKTFLELKKSTDGVAYLERLSKSNSDLYNKKKAAPGSIINA